MRSRVVALSVAFAFALAGLGAWAVARHRDHDGPAVARAVGSVRDAHPRLLPTKIPAGWKAQTTASRSFFTVTYTAPRGGQSLRIAIEVPDRPLPTATTTTRTMPFRADRTAAYQVTGDERVLLWWEPGTWAAHVDGTRTSAVPYALSARGLTEARFFAIAHSLEAVG